MAHELKVIDVTDCPDVLQLAEAVASSGEPVRLETHGERLAVVRPVTNSTRPRSGRALSRADSLFGLVGIGESTGENTGSDRKHEILADAYQPAE